MTGFIKFDCPETHVEVKNGDIGESIDNAHDFLNGRKRKWTTAMEIFVEHAEIGHKANLIVFLRH